MVIDTADVASVAAACRRGESARGRTRPRTRIEADTRKVEASVRSRLLNMRYLAPARYRELCADGTLALSEADRLLVGGQAQAAVRAYRDEITASADPRPDAWIGLALALDLLPSSPLQRVFAAELALDVRGARLPRRPGRPAGPGELVRVSPHPAPWPLLDLDVAAVRGAGHEPVPFQQFIVKVHSRCNLSCSYCYVYEMADQAWRQQPKRMSRPVAAKMAERIAEHAGGMTCRASRSSCTAASPCSPGGSG